MNLALIILFLIGFAFLSILIVKVNKKIKQILEYTAILFAEMEFLFRIMLPEYEFSWTSTDRYSEYLPERYTVRVWMRRNEILYEGPSLDDAVIKLTDAIRHNKSVVLKSEIGKKCETFYFYHQNDDNHGKEESK